MGSQARGLSLQSCFVQLRGDAWAKQQIEAKRKKLEKLWAPSCGHNAGNTAKTGAAARKAESDAGISMKVEGMTELLDLYLASG